MVVRATVELLSTDVAMLTNQIYLTQPQPPSSAPALPASISGSYSKSSAVPLQRTLPSPIDSRWNPGGIMDSTFPTWSPGGIFLAGSPAKLLSCSRWIPDGLRVDSRFSTWSPWNPPHSTSLDTGRATFQWTPPGLKIAQ